MNENQIAAAQLAQAIAGFRVQEIQANRALIVVDCQIRNLANRTHIDTRVSAALARVNAGIAAGTAQLGD